MSKERNKIPDLPVPVSVAVGMASHEKTYNINSEKQIYVKPFCEPISRRKKMQSLNY